MSFADVLNKKNINTMPETQIQTASLISDLELTEYENRVVFDESDYKISNKYDWYSKYSDENYSIVSSEKDIVVDPTQINLTQEENSQFIPFKMPRYWDGIDLMDMSIKIRYINVNKDEDIDSPCNVKYNSDSISFAWLVDRNVTALAGDVTFEIFATGVNEKGENYTWRTKPNGKLNILQSLVGNGVIQPDTDWITQFIREVDEKVATAQTASQEASEYAKEAKTALDSAQEKIDSAETILETKVMESVNEELKKYYTSEQIDEKFANIDISDQLKDIQNQIDNLDGLENFKVEYTADTHTLVFYNGETVIKSIVLDTNPTTEWVTAYDLKVDSKISDATSPITSDLDEHKTSTNADLKEIHKNIDDLTETLKTKYYDKEATDALLGNKASSSDVVNLTSRVSAVEQTANTNKTNITVVGNKIASLEDAIKGLETEPGKTYEITKSETDENIYILWEIENEGTDDEIRTEKSRFTAGGGGGGTTTSVLKIEYVIRSPLVVTSNDKAIIKYNFSGTDSSGDEVTEGIYTWKIDNRIIATGTAISGENTFDATEFISLGTQKLLLSITDDAGSLVTKSWSVQKIDIRIESSFNDKLTYPIGEVSFDYTPYGAISKDIHFKLDGVELYKVTTGSSGVPMSYNIQPQTHGAHLVEVYITAEINSSTVESNHIYKDVIWYDAESDVPVIGCVSNNLTVQQYDTNNIVYTVYDPKTETPTVVLAVDGKEVSNLQLDTNIQTWQYKPTDVGNHVLTISCRETVKTINVTVEKLDIDVEPVTAGLQFDFNPIGKSNNDTNKLWVDENNEDVKMTVSDNFDWENGGYQIDENGDSYFGVKAGTTATISYNLFADDARRNGKEFKLVFKTENVADANATFLSCESAGIGLQMNVHEAYIKASAKSLYVPYSEEDIIEWEFNISKDTDIPIVMSYEDGTPCRPMSYTSDYSFTQETTVPITFGSDDCDVRIYRMKAYNASLTSKAILSNFIADARTATDMVSRYKRNQIYDENQMLTPENLAKACPDLRIIKIESPIFTNDKKNYIKNASMECIYKNGDAILDNWKVENGYVVGQGTTSNEYGQAGRNLDFIFCADGIHQINSKIPFDANYKSKITFGDGSVIDDGTGKISLTRDSIPMNWTNFKLNIASSEMVNNAYLQKRYNDYIPYTSPAQKRDSRIKNDMEFVNCVIFIKESNPDISTHREFQDREWHFYGLANMGDSKKSDVTRAYDPDDMNEFCIEISDNTLPNSIFQTGVTNEDGTMKYPISKDEWKAGNTAYDSLYANWDGSFEFRYDCCGDSKDGQATSTDEIKEQIRTNNRQIWRDFYEFVITSSDEEFVNNLKNWFIVDSALYFYLFTLRYTMLDNRAKNVFPHWAKYYISTKEASEMGDKAKYYTVDDEAAKINKGYRFDFFNYDNDSSLGINNSGELTMTYGKEDTDYRTDGDKSSGYVFNAAESVFFCRIRDLMNSQLRTMYASCESKNCWSAQSLINEFDSKQNEWCEELWRLDYERKYERTYRDGNTRFLEQMMNGKKKYQRRQFERDQEMYMATKFIGTTATSDQIMFRCNTPASAVVKPDYTLHLTPYSDMYLSVMFGNSSPTQVRAKAGKSYDIPCPYTTMDDTAVLIYGASKIQSMGDVSAAYIHDNDFSKAEKLKELIIGSTTEGYTNTFLTNLVIGNNKLLEKLDVRNTPNLSNSLDFSKCGNLKEFYATGSGLTGVLFANGGKIQTALLPETLTSINMRNLKYLNNLKLDGYDKIATMIIENCSTIDSMGLLKSAINTNRIRLIGVDWQLDSIELLERLYKMGGIDKNGYNTDNSVVTGKVHVPVMKEKLLAEYNAVWTDLEITYDTLIKQHTVTFQNENGNILDVQYVDNGSDAEDPITREKDPIPTPTKESTISHNFTFDGWDISLKSIFSDRVIKATYTSSLREYTITYVSKGVTLQTSKGLYGDNIPYDGDIPTYTLEESAYKYYLFSKWDKSGIIDGDKTVSAVFDSCSYTEGYFGGKDISGLKPVEIYMMTKLGLESSCVETKDSITIPFGNDYNYDDVESTEIISKKTVFNGTNYIDSKIALFDEDKDFVLAIDYKMSSSSPSLGVLTQCFQFNGSNGFKLWNNNGVKVTWGTTSESVGSLGTRDILVLRHVKGEQGIHVYHSDINIRSTSEKYINISRTKDTIGTSTLVFGCSKADDGLYENYGIGEVYWAKVWYADLGDSACREMAVWTHEKIPVEMTGFKNYYLSDDSGKRCSMTFLAANLLDKKFPLTTTSSSSNSGGWANMDLNRFLNARLYKAISPEWRQLLKKVKVASSIGNKSTEISYSDCYLTIPAIIALDATRTTEPFIYEGNHVPYITTDETKVRTADGVNAMEYFTRSPNVNFGTYFYTITDTGSINGYVYPYIENGILLELSI
jgi:hypothetical protein